MDWIQGIPASEAFLALATLLGLASVMGMAKTLRIRRFSANRIQNPKSKIQNQLWQYAGLALVLAWVEPDVFGQGQDRSFTLGRSTLRLHDDSSEVNIRYQSLRLNRALNAWNVDVVIENKGSRRLRGPFVLSLESVTNTSGALFPDGIASGTGSKPFFDLSGGVLEGELGPGIQSAPRTITLALGTGAPSIATKLFTLPGRIPAALALTRTLDEAGLPLTDVDVEETGPLGSVTNRTDPIFGVLTLGQAVGEHTWKFSKTGFLSVWRRQMLSTGAVSVIPHPRLYRRNTNTVGISPIGGAQWTEQNGALQLTLSPGSVAQSNSLRITPLNGQALPGFLPQGWSPMQAFHLELPTLAFAPVAHLRPWGAIEPTETAVLARWNETTLEWTAVQLMAGNGSNAVSVTIPQAGAYVLAVADAPPNAPPLAAIGEGLPASSLALPNPSTLTASGSVEPSSSPASRVPAQVTATAEVIFTNQSGPLPSGVILHAELRESYRLRDGTPRQPPRYDTFVVGYQRPGDAEPGTLHSRFLMRPMLLFGVEELAEATVRADVMAPESFSGTVLDVEGAQVVAAGLRILAGEGDTPRRQAAQLRRLVPTNFVHLVAGHSNVEVMAAFELAVSGVTTNRQLAVRLDLLPTNLVVVLARVVYEQGLYGLQPVERLTSDFVGRLGVAEPATGERLAGLLGAGQYLLLKLPAAQGLVTGTTRNASGQATAGMPARIGGQPWLTFSDAVGKFRLLAPTGAVEITVTDPVNGDTGVSTSAMLSLQTGLAADVRSGPTGPRVVSVSPTNGATRVARVTPVVVSFSEPVNAATLLNGGMRLLGSNGLPVEASLTLNSRGNLATLLPANPLGGGARHAVVLSSNVTDLSGQPLEGPARFEFVTASDVLDRAVAQVFSYEPTNGLAIMMGTAGITEPETPMILVNETTGETRTILSRPDGSFSNSIPADVDDFLSAVVVNGNGTRNTIPVGRQLFRDGSVALFKGGGILEAESDGGPVQVIIEPGAIPTKTKMKVDFIPVAELLTLVQGQGPDGGAILGGIRYQESGDALKVGADVAFPVNVADLPLPPGVPPTNGTFVLAIPKKFDGVVVYDLIDTLEFEPTEPGKGKLASHSPPFPGLLARKLAAIKEAIGRFDGLGQVSVSSTDPTKSGVVLNTAVLSFDFPLSAGAKISGTVKSSMFDASGTAIGDKHPVAGALVAAGPVASERPPGLIRPGELVCYTGTSGQYAMFVRPGQQDAGREVLAAHPRFPFQTARAPIQLDAQNTSVARADLVLREGLGGVGVVQGSSPPVLQIAHFPPLPPAGPDEEDTAELVVTAFDDQEVQDPVVTITGAVMLDGRVVSEQEANQLYQKEIARNFRVSASRTVQKVKIHGTVQGKVKLKVVVTDGGLSAQLDYVINFGLGATVLPDPNDKLGLFVQLAWPPNHAERIPPLSPILLRFSEPIADDALQFGNSNPQWLTFDEHHRLVGAQASSDGREVLIFYDYDGEPNEHVHLTVSPALHGRDTNAFDQKPGTEDPDAFELSFTEAEQRSVELDGTQGSGVVVQGRYAYIAKRESSDGKLSVLDLEDLDEPDEVTTRALRGRPSVITLIPPYNMPAYEVTDTGQVSVNGCVEKSFVAVFTGVATGEKRLTLYRADADITEEVTAKLTPGVATIQSGGEDESLPEEAFQVIKARWDPPFIGYSEIGDNYTAVTLLNLNSFHLGAELSRSRLEAIKHLPRGGDPGLDLDGDGSYCLPEDVAPLPFLDPLHPFGFSFSYAPADPAENIRDFDFLSGLGLMAVLTDFNDVAKNPIFRIVLSSTAADLSQASVELPNARPKGLVLLPAVSLETDSGIELHDIAIIAAAPRDLGASPGGTAPVSGLIVLDVTDPAAPKHLVTVPVPASVGQAQGLVRRADGLLALAATAGTLLVDPTKLLLSGNFNNQPAFVTRLDLPLAGAREFVSDPSGLNVVYMASSRRLVQSAPQFQVVVFDEAPFNPESLVGQPAADITAKLARARPVQIVETAVVDENGDIIPDLAPERHHYVLVDAPGGELADGRELPLMVAAVNENGLLYDKQTRNVVPVVIGDDSVHKALLLKQLIRIFQVLNDVLNTQKHNTLGREMTLSELAASATSEESVLRKVLPDVKYLVRLLTSWPQGFTARRLSDDPASPLYNRYLAGPLLVLPNSPEEDIVATLLGQAEQAISGRRYLRASPRLWVGFPQKFRTADFSSNPVLGQFASLFKLNPNISFEGIDFPLDSILEDLLGAFLDGSPVVGPIILAAINRFTPVSTDFKPTLLPGASKLMIVGYKDRPILFIPDFAGSRLNQQSGEVWPAVLSFGNLTNLVCNQNGTPLRSTVPPDALRFLFETGSGNFKFGEVYGGIIRFLKRDLGIEEYDYFNPAVPTDPTKSILEARRRIDGAPNLSQGANADGSIDQQRPELFVFAADWRLDHSKAVDLLEKYVRLMQFYHPDAGGIDIVAHGSGNYLARELMRRQPNAVRRYVAIGAPWLGTGKALTTMLTGDVEDLALNFLAPMKQLRVASQFMPALHQLLPNKAMFDFGFRPVVELGWDANHDGTNFQTYGYTDYRLALETNLFRTTHAEAGFTGAISPALANHELFQRPPTLPIANAANDPEGTETHQIVAVQAAPRTIAGVRFVGRLHANRTRVQNVTLDLPAISMQDSEQGPDLAVNVGDADGSLGISSNQFRLRGDMEFVRTLGDGSVPLLSMTRGFGSSVDLNSPHSKLHCLASDAVAHDDDYSHLNMLNHPTTREWLDRIFTGRRIDRLNLQMSAPGSAKEGDTVTVTASGGGGAPVLIDFGDGSSGALLPGNASLTHQYRQNGAYMINAAATSNDRRGGFASRRIEIQNVAPQVTIEGGSITVPLNDTRVFVARVVDPGMEDTHTFTWKLDGNTLLGQHAFATAINFVSSGEHSLEVTAEDSDGARGQATIQVTVTAGLPPAPPPPVFAGAGGGAPGPVFPQQPEVVVRITGLRSGLLGLVDTKGATVVENGVTIWEVASVALPLVAGSPTVTAASAGLRQIYQAAVDTVVERPFSDTEQVHLLRRLDAGGAGTETTVKFNALGGPLEVELTYTEGGVPLRLAHWETNITALTPMTLKFNWTTRSATLEGLFSTIPPNFQTTDPVAAADRQPPVVLGVFNPANGLVTIVGRDNLTPTNKLQFFLVQDSSGNGLLDDEVFYELATNVLVRARLPSRKFTIVARDEAGNVTALAPFPIISASDYTIANAGSGGYCDDLAAIQGAVRTAIQRSLAEVATHEFLLDSSHLWVFEQGSGACLWRGNACDECKGNFKPGISDNDYELFLPAHLQRGFQPTPPDRAEFLAAGPHDPSMMIGDWYFRRPEGLDANGVPTSDLQQTATWLYRVPPGFSSGGLSELLLPKIDFTGDLSDGFPVPLTPAEVLAKTFTEVVRQDANLRKQLPQTSFFPVRREHFMFGALDLELPPEFGDDPIGDSGTGRQLLLLKWALEGAFVTSLSGGVNSGAVSLDTVYNNMHDFGVPVGEGLEWGLFQEFVALRTGLAVDVRATYGPSDNPQPLHSPAGNDLEAIQRKKLKQLGKSAIRAAAARLASDPFVSGLLFSINRHDYQTRHLASFEDMIFTVLHDNPDVAEGLFADFATDRPIEDGPDLQDFLELKKGENEALFDEIFKRPELYRRFVEQGLVFLRRFVQDATLPTYQTYLDGLLQNGHEDERSSRAQNLHRVLQGGPAHAGLIELRHDFPEEPLEVSVSINNYATVTASGLRVHAGSDGPPPAPAPSPAGPFRAANTQDLTVPDAAPISGSALEDPGEPKVELTAPLAPGVEEKTEVVVIDPVVPVTGPPAPEEPPRPADDQTTIVREELNVDEAPPAVTPVLALYLVRGGNEIFLEDWPEGNGLLRSPRYMVRSKDQIKISMIGPPNEGVYLADLQSLGDAREGFPIFETGPGSGLYEGTFHVTGDLFNDGLGITDEELIEVDVRGAGLTGTVHAEVMIDRAEFASGGIETFYFAAGNDSRTTVRNAMLTVAGYDDAGNGEFPNDVGAQGNQMRTFILEAGADNTGDHQADILHFTCHGLANGNLVDHATPGNLILDPDSPNGFVPGLHWNKDVEWVTLDACLTLNNGGGSTAWGAALKGDPRPAHGVLGFFRTVPGDIRDYWQRFHLALSVDDKTFIDAFKEQMVVGPRGALAWAVRWHSRNTADRLFEMTQDDRPDGIVFFDFNDVISVCGKAEECCGDALFGTVEPNAGQLRVPLGLLQFPEHAPAPMRLRRSRVLSEGKTPGRLVPTATQREVFEVRPTGPREFHSSLTQTAAVQVARQFIETNWPGLAPSLRFSQYGALHAGVEAPGQPARSWLNGHQVRFELLQDGIPVWGDSIDVTLQADKVQRCVALRHAPPTEPQPESAPATPSPQADAKKKVLAPLAALRQALAPLKRSLRIKGEYEVLEAGLFQVSTEVLGRVRPGQEELFVTAWHFLIDAAPPTAPNGHREVHDVWLDATNGQLLSPAEVKP